MPLFANPSPGRAANRISWTLSWLPLLTILLFYGGVLHARFVLGHWPAPDHPDPKATDFSLFDIHRTLIAGAAMITSVSPIVWLIILPVVESSISLKSFSYRLALYLLGLAAFLAFCQIDPGDFIGWFLD